MTAQTTVDENELIELGQDLRQAHDHIVDSTNLLIFTFLLILVIVTIWVFKHKRIPYVHETGLAIIYGAVFGIIIRYGFKQAQKKPLYMEAANLSLINIKDLPESVYLTVPNHSQIFVYSYKNPIRKYSGEAANSQDYEEKATFDPEIFFNLLLPPIIFHAGYSMKKKHFFKNFGAILMFALIGTTISCFFTAGFMYVVISMFRSIKDYFTFSDCMFFGAIISATDPVTVLAIFNDQKVNVNLYALVFGESVLNDAVSIILAQAIEKYSVGANSASFDQVLNIIYNICGVFFTSFLIGAGMGCFTALLTKFTYIRQHPNLETALFILMSYSTFLTSEALGLTGIVSVLFNGIFQAHYTYNNLSKDSQNQTKELFNLLNFLSENFIFIYIGITLFTFRSHQWEISFIFFSLIAIILARAVNIYPLAFIINLSRSRRNKIDKKMQNLMVFSGLRGAMAFALAIRNTSTQARRLILTTTSIIVITTVILCGGMTNQVIKWLEINSGPSEDNMIELNTNQNQNGGEAIDTDQSFWAKFKRAMKKVGLFRAWHSLDNHFMKPLLTNSVPALTDTMPRFFLPLTTLLTTKEQIGMSNLTNTSSISTSSQESTVIKLDTNNPNDKNPPILLVNPFEVNSELEMDFSPNA